MSKSVRRVLAGLGLAVSAAVVPVALAQDASSAGAAQPVGVRPVAGSPDLLRMRSAPRVPAADGAVFPIRGAHRYGTGAAAFGGGRGHQGQDVFADCGTPLVAAVPGRVGRVAFESAAGNYVVIDAADGTSQVYMHLARPATVAAGDHVDAGDRIGLVGQTGDAEGCHLHFESWTSPGWYQGGHPVDPLPRLRRWDGPQGR